jgi:8-oxo-dGTP pyrophosphatase MutT (NUDIX family)
MRFPIQIQGIICSKTESGNKYLFLKRKAERGGFWQPLSGGVEEGETLKSCLLRELLEETNICDVVQVINTNFKFQFKVDDEWLTEYVFMALLDKEILPVLSDEHEDYKWVTFREALELTKWDDNKKALEIADKLI